MSISTGSNPLNNTRPRPKRRLTAEEVSERRPIETGGKPERNPLPSDQKNREISTKEREPTRKPMKDISLSEEPKPSAAQTAYDSKRHARKSVD